MKTITLIFVLLLSGFVNAQTYHVDKGSKAIYLKTDSTIEARLKKELFKLGYSFEFKDGFWNTTNGQRLTTWAYPVYLMGMIEKVDTGYILTIKGKYDTTRGATAMNGGRYMGTQSFLDIESRATDWTIHRAAFIQMFDLVRKLGTNITFENVDGLKQCLYEW